MNSKFILFAKMLTVIVIMGVAVRLAGVSFAAPAKQTMKFASENSEHFIVPKNDYVGQLYACGDYVYYETGNAGEYNDWRTDGTLVEEVDTPSEAHKSYQTWCANELHLRFSRGQLWRADGPTEARYVVKEISGAILQIWQDELYFFSSNDDGSNSLWKSDGTAEGTVLLATFTERISNNGRILDSAGDESALYFMVATEPAGDPKIWQTDGTSEGTVVVDEGAVYFSDVYLRATDSDVFVTSYSSVGKMDDASATTAWSYAFEPQSVAYPTSIGDTLYFAASDGEHGKEIWRSDGTTAGTFMLQDIYSGVVGSGPFALTPVDNDLYFVAHSTQPPETIMELWKTDGSVAGTGLVKQFVSSSGSEDFGLVNMGDELVFWSAVSGYRSLWLTGGAVSGVEKIMDFNGIDTDNMLVHNDVFYFVGGKIPGSAIQLWKRDCRGVGAAKVGAAVTHAPLANDLISVYLPLLQTAPFVDTCVIEPISDQG